MPKFHSNNGVIAEHSLFANLTVEKRFLGLLMCCCCSYYFFLSTSDGEGTWKHIFGYPESMSQKMGFKRQVEQCFSSLLYQLFGMFDDFSKFCSSFSMVSGLGSSIKNGFNASLTRFFFNIFPNFWHTFKTQEVLAFGYLPDPSLCSTAAGWSKNDHYHH